MKKDELYFVIEKCQDGWFKGSSLTTLKTGVFPGNYVLREHVQDVIAKQKTKNEPSNSDLIDFSCDIMDVFGATKQKSIKQKKSEAEMTVKTSQANPILYR